jgi:hypothetical protein
VVERALSSRDPFTRHAAARVESNPEADGNTLGAEVRHLLHLGVFVHDESLHLEIGYEPAVRVGHARGDIDQLDPALEAESGIGILGRRLLRVQRNDNERDRRDHRNGYTAICSRLAAPAGGDCQPWTPPSLDPRAPISFFTKPNPALWAKDR